MVITRRRHPLEGLVLPVLGRMRRHGRLELLLVLPDGSKSLIPAAWTDLAGADTEGAPGEDGGATLGSVADLLGTCALVADLAGPRCDEQGQAARQSPAKEDCHAAWSAQFDTRPASGATGDAGRGSGHRGRHGSDHCASQGDRPSRSRGGDRGQRR
ncbi:MAG: Y4bD/Y4pK family protein [Actinobacteria bacterium]|nr:Y4bD/Y4pK family protein [Actinomycetota bacterium]